MPRLLSDTDLYAYLGVDQATDDPAGAAKVIRDAVEDLLVLECNREFGDETSMVDESYDGPGSRVIYTRRPIKTLTGIKFRYLTEQVQDQYFNLDITQYVTWTPGKRRIHSLTYEFPCGYDNVLITYTASADKPNMATQAVREATAMLWRARGSEDARSEQMGTFQHVMHRSLDESIFWKRALEALTIPMLA